MRRVSSFVILLGFVVSLQCSCTEQNPDEVEARIAASPKLSEIDKICNELPKPQSFRQIRKQISGNAGMSIIVDRYASNESFEVVRDFYLKHSSDAGFNVTGGTLQETNSFINDIRLEREGVAIGVENRPPSAIFNVGCSK